MKQHAGFVFIALANNLLFLVTTRGFNSNSEGLCSLALLNRLQQLYSEVDSSQHKYQPGPKDPIYFT